jgi:hypothetical protein
VTVNDVQTFGAMVEGIELVSNLITRSTILERLYLQTTEGMKAAARDQLLKAILGLHTAVLQYLSKARRYYSRNTIGASTYPFLFPIYVRY